MSIVFAEMPYDSVWQESAHMYTILHIRYSSKFIYIYTHTDIHSSHTHNGIVCNIWISHFILFLQVTPSSQYFAVGKAQALETICYAMY